MTGLPIINPTPYAPGSAVHAFAVTSATAFPTTPTRYVWVGTAQTAFTPVMTGDATGFNWGAIPAGTMLEISVTEITATPGTGIVGLY